jgi:hypothetical protein
VGFLVSEMQLRLPSEVKGQKLVVTAASREKGFCCVNTLLRFVTFRKLSGRKGGLGGKI